MQKGGCYRYDQEDAKPGGVDAVTARNEQEGAGEERQRDKERQEHVDSLGPDALHDGEVGHRVVKLRLLKLDLIRGPAHVVAGEGRAKLGGERAP